MAQFHIRKGIHGGYMYRLREGHSRVMLWGLGEHSTKIACQSSISVVRANSGITGRYVSSDIPGYYWFTLQNALGERLGMSEAFANASDRDQGLRDVMKAAPEADTEDTLL